MSSNNVGVLRIRARAARFLRVWLAMLVTLPSASIPVLRFATPALSREGCPQRGVTVWSTISGKVLDVRGGPIAGATVYWTYKSTTTDGEGRYSILLDAQCPTDLWATHSLYAPRSIYIENPVLASAVSQDFVLPYRLSTSVSPSAFNNNPQKTLTFTTYTTAPAAGTRAIVQLPDGSVIQLASVVSDRAGWSKWTGAWSVPAGTPDGRYTYKSCALDELAAGTCDAVVGLLLSEVAAATYAGDSVAPVVASTWPPRFGDVLQLASITATWQDPVSGVDPASLKMWIDGVQASVSISGSSASTSASGVTAGIHLVEVEASDLAGNLRRDSFLFTLVTIAASPGTATLLEATVSVNPSGQIPPPSKVRFVAPQVAVSETTETLNATTRVGYGTSRRDFGLGAVDVVFRNELGVTTTVSVTVPPSTESHWLGALGPSTGPLKAVIGAHNTSIPDIAVSVPTGFNTSGSTASLVSKVVQLGNPLLSSGAFLSNTYSGKVPVLGTIGYCFSGDAAGRAVECDVDLSARVVAKVPGLPDQSVAVPIYQDPDAVTNTVEPDCSKGCEGNAAGNAYWRFGSASMVLKCPAIERSPIPPRNLCSGMANQYVTNGPWGVFLNAWIYKEAGAGLFPLWQQDRASATSAQCPNGAAGSVKGWTYRVAANTTANDGSEQAIVGGTWDDPVHRNPADGFVYLGERTGNNRKSEPYAVAFQLSNESPIGSGQFTTQLVIRQEGYYVTATAEASMDARGQTTQSASSTTNGWQWDTTPDASLAVTTPGISGDLQIMTGSEFRSPKVSGNYNLSAQLAFQFVLEFSCG